MRTNPIPPRRRSPVHQPIHWDEDGTAILFLTVNTQQKKQILARPDIHRLLLEAWAEADDWLVGRYVIMPDHVHFLCSPFAGEINALE